MIRRQLPLILAALLLSASTVAAAPAVPTLALVSHLASDPAAPFDNRGSFTFSSTSYGGRQLYLIFNCRAEWLGGGISESSTPPLAHRGDTETVYYRNGLHHSGLPYCDSWEAWIAKADDPRTPVSNVLGGDL